MLYQISATRPGVKHESYCNALYNLNLSKDEFIRMLRNITIIPYICTTNCGRFNIYFGNLSIHLPVLNNCHIIKTLIKL